MKIIRAPSELQPGSRKVSVAIGVFDGVHLGHQAIISRTVAEARAHHALSLVLTFDRHPNAVVAPERAPALIYPLSQKLRGIGSLDPDAALLIHFDADFSSLSGEQFIRLLLRDIGALESICVGDGFTFGARRSGNVALLQKLGRQFGFAVHALEPVALDGEPVSSTRIRRHLRAGDFDVVSRMLGRAYMLCGNVVAGDHLGRQLGFPTANLDSAGLEVPPHGVYAVFAQHRDARAPAVLNIGVRPTLQQSAPTLRVEAHLLDYQGDLYGQELRIEFVRKLRDELKFPSLDALRAQIQNDIAAARAVFD